MKKIRQNVFETNSSSTHSITIVSQDDFNKWKNDEMYLYDTLISIEEAQKMYNEEYSDIYDNFDEWCNEYGLKSYYDWKNNEELETYTETYTSKSGDKIVVFGEFGYN